MQQLPPLLSALIVNTPIHTSTFEACLIPQPRIPESHGLLARYQDELEFEVSAALLLPIYPISQRVISLAISQGFSVLARMKAVPWEKYFTRIDLVLVGYDSAGAIAFFDGERRKIPWGFLAQHADTAYIPIPELTSEQMRRSFDCDALAASLAAR